MHNVTFPIPNSWCGPAVTNDSSILPILHLRIRGQLRIIFFYFVSLTEGDIDEGLCAFPFTYKDITYPECTSINNKGQPWCSTTHNYDRQWRNCLSSELDQMPVPVFHIARTRDNPINNISTGLLLLYRT